MASRRIGFLLYPDLQALDLVGPMDAFAAAVELADGDAPYELVTIGLDPGPVRAEGGLVLHADLALEDAPALDTLVVPGGLGSRAHDHDTRLVGWLRSRVADTRRVMSTCTGLYLLAATGMLDGRRVTTHWRFAEDMKRRHPELELDVDALYLADGPFRTSGGLTAGIDLSLALIEEDLGSASALAVARHLVMYMKRPGDQAQFSEPLQAQSAGQGPLAELSDWLLAHLDEDLPVGRMADQVNMSERNFRRAFAKQFQTTPARFVERLRLERACSLLTSTRSPVDRIAEKVGFETGDTFRRAFRRRYGTSPREYRERFS